MTTYQYNTHGVRVSALREVDTDGDGDNDTVTETEYLNNPHNPTGYSQVLQETVRDPATGHIQKRIVYTLGHNKIAQTTITYSAGSSVSRKTLVLLDMLGAIATVEAVQQIFHYDAYGNLLNMDADEAATSILYAGQMLDPGSDWYYNLNRWYDPVTGRFNRLDPFFGNLSDPQSLHKHLYVHADPVNFIDPTGLRKKPAWFENIDVLGTHVSTYIGRVYKRGGTDENPRFANQEIRTIAIELNNVILPRTDPYNKRPDLAGVLLAGQSGEHYEIKRGDFVGLIRPGILAQDARKAERQLRRDGGLLNANTTLDWTRGDSYLRGVRPHPLFRSPRMPANTMLVTFNDYDAHPGVLLYDFIKRKTGRRLTALDVAQGAVGLAMASAIANEILVARKLGMATQLAVTARKAERARLRMTTATYAGPSLLAAGIGSISINVSIGF